MYVQIDILKKYKLEHFIHNLIYTNAFNFQLQYII